MSSLKRKVIVTAAVFGATYLLTAALPYLAQSQVVNPGVQQVAPTPANNDCTKWVVSGGNVVGITTSGAGCTAAVVPGGASGNVQFNNGGAFGGLTDTQLTARINAVTSALPGSIPAFPSDGTKFFSGLGTYLVPPYPVTSVFGRTGAVIAVANDYNFNQLAGSVACAQLPALTGDVTSGAGTCATTLANIPSGVPVAGNLLATNIVAPGTPAAGKTVLYVDSTTKRLSSKNDAGVVGTDVVADTGAANNFLTAISAAGVISKAQPAFTNISGTLALATQVSGTLAVANGGTGDTGTAWTAWTPTITCGAGTVGAYSIQVGRYKTLGKTVWMTANVAAAAGTCSGTIQVTNLPFTSVNILNANYALVGADGNTAAALAGFINPNSAFINLFTSAGGNPTVAHEYIVSGTYETQ